MDRRTFSQIVAGATAAVSLDDAGLAQPPASPAHPDLTMWYPRPAATWNEALKVGNGRLGATVFGIPAEERIGLNHTWLWRKMKLGGLKNPVVAQHLPAIRKLFFDGRLVEANREANRLLGSQEICKPDDERYRDFGPDPYQPAGDLNLTMPGHEPATGYRRSLDLASYTATTTYESAGVRYLREVFASYADDLILIRLTASRPGAITGAFDLFRVPDKDCTLRPSAQGGRIALEGEFLERLKFAITAQVWLRGGSGEARVNSAQSAALWSEESDGRGGGRSMRRVGRPEFAVRGADEVLIAVALATDQESPDPLRLTETQLEAFRPLEYAGMAARHRAAYGKLFDRMSVELEGPDRSSIPTDERMAAHLKGADDPRLVAQRFQYERSLLIGSSRAGGAPANLTGIWNEMLRAAWNADIHHDDGFNDRYWHAQPCNLAECAAPVFEYLDRCIEPAREAARNLYGCRGIYIPLSNDAWARCLKVEPGWDEWSGAAAWLAQHYWWQYEFHGDEDLLRRRIYPFMKEAALFYEDYLVEDPRPDSRFRGKLVTVPSQSPENTFVGGGVAVPLPTLCIAATMDLELIHDLLTHCIRASEVLAVDADQRPVWRSILDRLPPLQIGKHGQLQEWLEDYEEAEPGHRHISHLWGLYPGDQITVEDSPELARACSVTLERRYRARSGAEGGGAFPGYTSKMYARLGNAPLALRELRRGSLGEAAATVTEMVMQSHRGELRFLPALPAEWPAGTIHGIRARGGFEVDLAWREGALVSAAIRSDLGNRCRIRTKTPLEIREGATRVQTAAGEGAVAFETRPGGRYEVRPGV